MWFYSKEWFLQQLLWVAEKDLNCAALEGSEERAKCIASAFEAGAGVLPSQLSSTISIITLTAVFLWVAWLAFSQYQSFANGDITFYDLIWRVIRGVIVLVLFTFILM